MLKAKVMENIRNANDLIGAENPKVLDAHGVLAVNLMASPGAGKTSLPMRTMPKKCEFCIWRGSN